MADWKNDDWHRGQIHPRAAQIFSDGLEDSLEPIRDEIMAGRFAQDMVIQWEDAAVNLCESPIEQMMLARLMFTGYGYRRFPVEIWDVTMPFPRGTADITIAPQYPLDGKRVDLAVFALNFANEELRIAVECDGHDFHERTKAQAARDRSRDRAFQLADWKVFRFTGSEIWRDPWECAMEVDSLVADFVERDLIARGLIDAQKK